ncbi:hypothetical protein BHM03_00023761 [Ensete ventricosum]|nr:hypothetical protein BHM03_00023761 [Ensete ventricosum]
MTSIIRASSSSSSPSFFPSKLPSFHSKPAPNSPIFDLRLLMSTVANPSPRGTEDRQLAARCHAVPGLSADEVVAASDEAFGRHSFPSLKRSGSGVAIMWFRNDLRLMDNEALVRAWAASQSVLPVYCVDPRNFGATHYFGFPKTGALRAQFLIECLEDLQKNLMKRGLNLLVRFGKPEDILPSIARAFSAHTVYAQKETCSEELLVEKLVLKVLVWGSTMYHIDDIPFSTKNLPDVYTQFRKAVESKCSIRGCFKLPVSLGPPPNTETLIIAIESPCVFYSKMQHEQGIHFLGGENAALGRIFEYFWKKACNLLIDMLRVYKETRNGMLGPDYSTKFSPWLASGSLSPRYIYEEVCRYEKKRVANDSTYWVLFELIWRDYFKFVSMKHGNSIFHLGGPRNVVSKWSQDQSLFESWRDGRTGYPLIDANMKELSTTGFMSNRGRQIVCSFLVRDMGIDWRMGAEWFETCLLDYDPASNYGNWTYGAGVGNDPREDRYFSIPKQAKNYDPEGEYVAYWLPELRPLPKERRNFPGQSYRVVMSE